MPDDQLGPLRPSGPPLGGDRELTFRKRSWFRKHRNGILAVLIVVVVIGGITGAVLATRNIGDVATGDASSSPSASASPSHSPTPTAHPTTPGAPKPPPKLTAKGKVVAVIGSGHWTVEFAKGVNITVVTNASTKYLHGKKASDVKRNTEITVVGTTTAGVITASTVTVEKKAST